MEMTLRLSPRPLLATLAPAFLLACPVLAQAPQAHPDDMILARKAVMNQAEFNLGQLEAAVKAGEAQDLRLLTEKAFNIAVLIQALPHLFGPETNYLGQPNADAAVETAADSKIWDELDAFYAKAGEVTAAAQAAASATDAAALAKSVADIRNACESCHSNYIVYQPFGAALGMSLEPADD